MKGIVKNMKEYEGNIKKYEGTVKEYGGNMKDCLKKHDLESTEASYELWEIPTNHRPP